MSINDEDITNIYKLDRTYKGKVYFELEKKDTNNPQEWINNNCNDKTNYLTSDDFTDEDYSDMYVIKILNSHNKFNLGMCSTKEELLMSLKSDLNFENIEDPTNQPSSIMSICTSPNDGNVQGYNTKPTIRIVIKLTINNIYVTLGSVHRIMRETKNKIWYALPLFDGKKRRIGNIGGILGSSMNHCQLPGFIIYKLYTKNEIINSVKVKQSIDDYPIGYDIENNVFTLFSLYDKYNINSREFSKKIVSDIEHSYLGDFDITNSNSSQIDFDDIEEKNVIVNTLQHLNTLLGTDPAFRLRIRNSPSLLQNIHDPVYVNNLRRFNNFNILIDEILAEQNVQTPQPINIRNLPTNLANIPLNVSRPRPINIRDLPINLVNVPLNILPRSKRSKTSRSTRSKTSRVSRSTRSN